MLIFSLLKRETKNKYTIITNNQNKNCGLFYVKKREYRMTERHFKELYYDIYRK